ncbi:MAG: hypothetical protein JNJ65_17245 [Cyclobacteriaceae bacterium]|nr:hypothetical protein [Cyclobacteriaceae bacterium]
MKYPLFILAILLQVGGVGFNLIGLIAHQESIQIVNECNNPMNIIKINVGKQSFTATLRDNATANAFKALLPFTASMTELNDNEKYFRLSKNLPTNESNPGTIGPGDLMLWGSNTVVLFYETFPTSYRYTMLGKIDNPTVLTSALGTGTVTVTFEAD